MENPKIEPDKITKPIQLLAVWFAGLVLLVGLLLAGAKTIQDPKWLVPVLTISAILIIPIFLYFIFLLQTKYRPQMQEDTFYSSYLDNITKQRVETKDNSTENFESLFFTLTEKFNTLSESTRIRLDQINEQVSLSNIPSNRLEKIKELINETDETIDKADFDRLHIAVNNLLNDSKKVKKLLEKHGIKIGQEFGQSNDIPPVKLITIGKAVSPKIILQIINMLLPLGYNNLNMTESAHQQNGIYIGSYAYKINKYLTIDNDLIDKIKNVKSISDLSDILPLV